MIPGIKGAKIKAKLASVVQKNPGGLYLFKEVGQLLSQMVFPCLRLQTRSLSQSPARGPFACFGAS